MSVFQIWCEGYLCSGMEGTPATARLIAEHEGVDFKDACVRANAAGMFEGYGDFDAERLSVWGCDLFDNEADARKAFG